MPNLGPDYDFAVRLRRIEDALARMGQNPVGQAFSSTQSDGSVGMSIYQDNYGTGSTATRFYQGPNTPRDPQTGLHPELLYIGQTLVGGVFSDNAVIGHYPSGAMSMILGAGGLGALDAAGNVVFTPDQTAGQGLARPYIPGAFYRSDYADWVTTTSTSFVTKFRAEMPKQHPMLYIRAWASNDTSGSTGQLQVLVNGTQWGPVQNTAFSISEYSFGPLAVPGAHESDLTIELQACVTSGTGGVRLEPSRLEGRQS